MCADDDEASGKRSAPEQPCAASDRMGQHVIGRAGQHRHQQHPPLAGRPEGRAGQSQPDERELRSQGVASEDCSETVHSARLAAIRLETRKLQYLRRLRYLRPCAPGSRTPAAHADPDHGLGRAAHANIEHVLEGAASQLRRRAVVMLLLFLDDVPQQGDGDRRLHCINGKSGQYFQTAWRVLIATYIRIHSPPPPFSYGEGFFL